MTSLDLAIAILHEIGKNPECSRYDVVPLVSSPDHVTEVLLDLSEHVILLA